MVLLLRMRNLAAIIWGITFVGVSLFGFVMIGHGLPHDACIAAVSKGVVCPQGANPLAFINFHLTILKSFSEALLNFSLWLGILAVSISILSAIAFAASPDFVSSFDYKRVLRYLALEFSASEPTGRFTRWLKILEKRDPRPIFKVV